MAVVVDAAGRTTAGVLGLHSGANEARVPWQVPGIRGQCARGRPW